MNTKRVNSAAGVIHAAQVNGKQTATGLAADLESACMLQDPEVAKELAAFRALELGDVDGRVSASCSQPHHPTWLRAVDDTRGCPWCEIDAAHEETIGANLARWEEERDNARLRLALASAQRGRRNAREITRHAVSVTDSSVTELEREHAGNARLREQITELEKVRAAHFSEAARLLEAAGYDDDAVNLLDNMANGIRTLATEAQQPDALTRLLAPTQALRADEDPCHPCGCPKRFARHADGCPTYSPATGCGDGPDQWCSGCSACRCEPHTKGCVKASAPR